METNYRLVNSKQSYVLPALASLTFGQHVVLESWVAGLESDSTEHQPAEWVVPLLTLLEFINQDKILLPEEK